MRSIIIAGARLLRHPLFYHFFVRVYIINFIIKLRIVTPWSCLPAGRESIFLWKIPGLNYIAKQYNLTLLVFIRECMVSLPLRISVVSVYGGAHSLVMDAPAEMPESRSSMCLPHPPVRVHKSRPRRIGGVAGGTPYFS